MSSELKVEIDGKPQKVLLEARKGTKFTFVMNSKPFEAEILKVEGSKVSLRLNGRAWEVDASEKKTEKGAWEARIGNRTRVVKTGPVAFAVKESSSVAAASKEAAKRTGGASEGTVEAPMPGKILKVFEGASVAKGELLVAIRK
jgi:biotin carboxyl carrier protein